MLRIFYQEFLSSFLLPFFILISVFGSLFPDIDLIIRKSFKSFGHRNPLTHSALFPLTLSLFIFTFSSTDMLEFLKDILFPFSAGVSSHLFGDLIGKGRVKGLKKGKYWLIINGMLSLPFFTPYLGEVFSKILKGIIF
ncbi:hypothetical protein HRbin06_00365 [archaeon HR06]|nr:hypothetical protein HRbin06_00365 [archaeon HR06]